MRKRQERFGFTPTSISVNRDRELVSQGGADRLNAGNITLNSQPDLYFHRLNPQPGDVNR